MESVSRITLFRPKNDGKIWSIFFFSKIPLIGKKVFFVTTKFVIWGKTLPFYDVSHKIEGILDYFSMSILGKIGNFIYGFHFGEVNDV